jgi:hypothetical protein
MKCAHPLPSYYYLDQHGMPARAVEWCGRCGAFREFHRGTTYKDDYTLVPQPWKKPATWLQRLLGSFKGRLG